MENINTLMEKSKKWIGPAVCVLGCILLIAGFMEVSNSFYTFELEHYEECLEGYEDCRDAAETSMYYQSEYLELADSYEEMMEDSYEEVQEYRTQAAILYVIGIFLVGIGAHIILKMKRTPVGAHAEISNCPACNAEVKKGANFCTRCGALLVEKVPSVVKKTDSNKYVLGGICVALVIVFIWYGNPPIDDISSSNRGHSSSNYSSGSDSDYSSAPKTEKEKALERAKSYLNSSAFSYEGLIDQLEYEGFSTAEATYGADNCGANWNQQALKKAKSYLNSSAFSYEGLVEQLEYEGFTLEEATYGVDNCGADWYEQAAKKAKSYLRSSSFTRSELIDQLEYEGFTYREAVYGVEQNGL